MSGKESELFRLAAGALLAVQVADPDRLAAAFETVEVDSQDLKDGSVVLTTQQIQTICREVGLSYEGLMDDVEVVIEKGGIPQH